MFDLPSQSKILFIFDKKDPNTGNSMSAFCKLFPLTTFLFKNIDCLAEKDTLASAMKKRKCKIAINCFSQKNDKVENFLTFIRLVNDNIEFIKFQINSSKGFVSSGPIVGSKSLMFLKNMSQDMRSLFTDVFYVPSALIDQAALLNVIFVVGNQEMHNSDEIHNSNGSESFERGESVEIHKSNRSESFERGESVEIHNSNGPESFERGESVEIHKSNRSESFERGESVEIHKSNGSESVEDVIEQIKEKNDIDNKTLKINKNFIICLKSITNLSDIGPEFNLTLIDTFLLSHLDKINTKKIKNVKTTEQRKSGRVYPPQQNLSGLKLKKGIFKAESTK